MSDPIDRLLPLLQGVRRSGPGTWMARCPAHEDTTASLSIREAADGRVLINDFGGCGAVDVVLAVGLDLADLFPSRSEISYGPSRARDPDIPRISAADVLRLLDREAFTVALVAETIAAGADPEPYRNLLLQSAGRIAEARQLWEGHP